MKTGKRIGHSWVSEYEVQTRLEFGYTAFNGPRITVDWGEGEHKKHSC